MMKPRNAFVLFFAFSLFALYPAISHVATGLGLQDDAAPAKEKTTTQTYDIRELLVQVPNFSNAPNYQPSPTRGAQGQSVPGGVGFPDLEWEEDVPSRQELVDQIVELITTQVGDIDEWLDEESTLTELNGQLVIRTYPQNHRAIRAMLDGFARDRRQMISIDAMIVEAEAEAIQQLLNDSSDGQFLLTPKQTQALLKSIYEEESLHLAATTKLSFFNGQRVFNEISPAAQSSRGDDKEHAAEILLPHGIFVFDVEATISMDRNYVISTLRPDFSLVRNQDDDADTPASAKGMYRATVTTEDGGAVVQTIGTRNTPEGHTTELMLIYRTRIVPNQ